MAKTFFFFTEYEVGERLRELEALDRRLEREGGSGGMRTARQIPGGVFGWGRL